MLNFIEISYFLFFIEYFLGIIIMFVLLTYLIVINNVYGLIINKSLLNSFILVFLSIFCLLYNDYLYFLIDLKFNTFNLVNNLFVFDFSSNISKLFLTILCSIFFLIIANLLNQYNLNFFEFIIVVCFNILGLFFLFSSYDLVFIFIAIELISFSSYLMVSFNKHCYNIESSLKYLIVGVLGSSIFLLGSFFFYYFTGSLELFKIQIICTNNSFIYNFLNNFNFIKILFYYEYSFCYINYFQLKYWFFEYLTICNLHVIFKNIIIELATILITTNFLIKLAFVPYHFWSIEIYKKTNNVVVFFLLLLPKLSFFVILVRLSFFFLSFNILIFYLIVIGIYSILIGSITNLNEKNIKLILVYSSINHSGFIILSYSLGSLFSLEIFYSYIIIYLFSNLIVWYVLVNLSKKNNINNSCNNVSDFVLLNKSNKILTYNFMLALFSFSGIPPFIGFFLKFNVFLSLLNYNFILIAGIIGLLSCVSTFYYIRLIKILYFENIKIGFLYNPIKSFNLFLFHFFTFLLSFLFVNPKFFYLIVHKFVLLIHINKKGNGLAN